MKKLFMLLLTLAVTLTLASCGEKEAEQETGKLETEVETESTKELPELDMVIGTREQDKIIAEYLQDVVKTEFGLTLNVLPFEKKYDEFKAQKFDIGYAGWGPDYNDADTYLHMWASGNYTSTYVGWEDSVFDSLMHETEYLPDGEERAAKLFEAEGYLLENGPIIPLFTRGGAYAVADGVEGFYKNFVGTENDYIFASTPNNTLRLASLLEPDSLDPQICNANWCTVVTSSMYEGLVTFHNNEYLPGMAESWEVSEDGMVYTFNIREDAKWADGTPINAQTYVDSLALLLTRGDTGGFSYLGHNIKNAAAVDEGTLPVEELGAKAVSEYVLEITLENPASYFLSLSTLATFYPVNAALYEELGGEYGTSMDKVVGNGPFKIVEALPQNKYVMEKDESYWNADAIDLDRIEVYIIPDETTQMNMFENGEIDVVDIAKDYVASYDAEGKAIKFDAGVIYYLKLSFGEGSSPEAHELATNRNFIYAVSNLIDRTGLVDSIFGEASTYAPSGRQVINGVTAYSGANYGDLYGDEDFGHPLTPNVELAKEYFQKALEELGYTE
ncbi:ABC transporter substrate-binding protein [Mycoplasmatota bacterium zrk1]